MAHASPALPCPDPNSGLRGRLARGSATSFSANAVSLGLLFASHLLLARLLGTRGFGEYMVAWTWSNFLVLFAKLGFDTAASRLVSEYRMLGQLGRLRGFVRRSTQLALVSSAAWSAATIGVLWLLRGKFSPSLFETLVWSAVALPPQAVNMVQQGSFRGFQRMGWMKAPVGLQAALIMGLVGLYIGFGGELSAVRAMQLTLIASTAVAWWSALELRRGMSREARTAPPEFLTREWLKLGGSLAYVSILQLAMRRVDILMVGVMVGVREAGIYAAVVRVAMLLQLPMDALTSIAGPIASEMQVNGRLRACERTLAHAVLAVTCVTLAGIGGLVLFGPQILSLFGPEYAAGQAAQLILAAGTLVNIAAGPTGMLLTSTGHHHVNARVWTVATIFNVIMNLICVPLWSINGAAATTSLTILFWNVWLWFAVRQALGVRAGIPALLMRGPALDATAAAGKPAPEVAAARAA